MWDFKIQGSNQLPNNIPHKYSKQGPTVIE